MIRHLDIESDHEMYVAGVHHAGKLETAPAVVRTVSRAIGKKAGPKRPLKKRAR
jgi:hypothetical protein